MNKVEYDPKWAICAECDGQGKFEDGQGQWWLCRLCAGYGSPAARVYGEKHPECLKPATLHAIDHDANKARANIATPPAQAAWSDIQPTLWGGLFYSVENQ